MVVAYMLGCGVGDGNLGFVMSLRISESFLRTYWERVDRAPTAPFFRKVWHGSCRRVSLSMVTACAVVRLRRMVVKY